MKTWSVALACCLLLASGAMAKADDSAVKAELEKLQGDWTVVSYMANGMAVPIPNDLIVTIIGNKMTTKTHGQTQTATISLDLVASPKHFDIVADDGLDKGISHAGIYELNGDEFKFCAIPIKDDVQVDPMGNPIESTRTVKVGERPKTFDEKSATLIKLKRKTPSKH